MDRGRRFICLAAGRGSRFGGLGCYLQKCMYPIDLTPFLELSVAAVADYAVDGDELVLVENVHGEQIRAYFGDRYGGLKIRYVQQAQPNGTADALRAALAGDPRDTVVWLADALVRSSDLDVLSSSSGSVVLAGAPPGHDSNPNIRLELDGDAVLRCWGGSGDLADRGLWHLRSEAVPGFLATRPPDEGEDRMLIAVQAMIDGGHDVRCVRTGEWIHLGGVDPTPEEHVRSVVDRVRPLVRDLEVRCH